MTIGIASDKNATKPEHELAPQALNGWPLFGKKDNVGDVPLSGPGDDKPIELGIDLTPLLKKLGSDAGGDSRLFLRFGRATRSDASGRLHACAIRSYDAQGTFVSESAVEVPDGSFGQAPLVLETILR
jgi:hypothetical protein